MLIVDAANVVGSRPTGWWRDRPKAGRELVERIRAATAEGRLPAPVVVVLEGAARSGAPEEVADGVAVVHAGAEGDDTMAHLAETAEEPVVMVTADRGLAARARRAGAEVVGPSWLYERLGEV